MSYVAAMSSCSIFETTGSETYRFRVFFRQRQECAVPQYGMHARHMCDAVQQLGFARRFLKSLTEYDFTLEKLSGVFLFEKNTAIWRTESDDR